ncbi:unnamed protein product [Closterium sp. NIES-65]|nr:unnamed protein product [Closterium sp. NIES-65]
MASPSVLAFDAEGRSLKFEIWLDDLHLFLQLTAKEDISLYDHALGHATSPAATADITARSQWQTRDAHARFAIRNSLPVDEREHFGQHKTAQALYTAVVARYSLPASAALGLKDHFLARCPTELTIDLLEKELLAAETSIVILVLSRSVLRPLRVGAAVARAEGAKEVEVTAGEAVVGVVAAVGVVAGLEGLVAAVGVVAAAAGEVAGAGAVVVAAVDAEAAGAVVDGVAAAKVVVVEALAAARASSRLRRPRSFTCGRAHTTQRCFSRLDDAWRTQFPAATKLPRWADLMKKNIDIYALDFDAILTAMYVASTSGEGAQYLRVPPDPGIRTSEATALCASASVALGAGEATALGARESAPPGTESTEALHTFTLDSGASHCFFRDRTALEQLARPVAVSPADPSGGRGCLQVHPCLRVRDTLHVCSDGPSPGYLHSAAGSDLYTLTTESPHVAASASTSGQLSPPYSCRSLAHETILWHHRLGHPSVQRLRAMHERYLVSGLPRVLPPLPPSPTPPCLPCVEGRQRAAPHSSSFPPTTAPLQTLHMDVWGPAPVRGQGQERYFLIVVDDYSRYTTVFPLRTKEVVSSPPTSWQPTVRSTASASRSRFRPLHSRMGLLAPHWLAQPLAPCLLAGDFPDTASDGEVGDASRFRVRGSRAFVRDTSADKLSSRAVPCVFLGFVPDVSGWQFYHATSRRVLPSQEVTFDEFVPYYCLFPYYTAPFSPPRLSSSRQADPVEPVEVAVDSCPARGAEPERAEPERAEPGGADLGGAEPGGAEPGGTEPGGAESGGAAPGGAEPGCAMSEGAEAERASPGGALSSQELREWRELPSPQRLREWYTRQCSLRSYAPSAADPSAGDAAAVGGAAGAGAARGAAAGATRGAPGAGAAGAAGGTATTGGAAGAAGAAGGAAAAGSAAGAAGGAAGAGAAGAAGAAGPGGARTGGTGASGSGPVEGVVAGGAERPRPYYRVPLPSPPASSLPALADPESDSLCAASPTVTHLLATVVTDPSFESSAASALVAELCALGTDVLEDRQEEFECFAAALPHLVSMLVAPEGDPDAPDIPTPRSYAEVMEGLYSSQWQTAMDAEIASWKSTGTYVDEVPPPGANIRDYELHSLDFSSALLQGSLYEEIWLRRPHGFTGSFPPGTHWSLRRPFYGLRQAPREWHDTLRTTLAALGFAPSTAGPSLFLCTDTSLPPFYILVYVDDLVFATADTAGLAHVKSELQKRHTCIDLGKPRSYLGLQITWERAQRTITLTQSHMLQQVL